MVLIKNAGNHLPANEIHDVSDEIANELTSNGNYVYVNGKQNIIIPVTTKMPDEKWTEKQIKEWLEQNNIPIHYHITNDEKKTILDKIKNHVWINKLNFK